MVNMLTTTATTLLLAAAAATVDAKALAWQADASERTWTPARETPPAAAVQLQIGGTSPRPTPAPAFREADIFKRAVDNTCGYISGSFVSAMYCETDATCVTNRALSVVGCCPTSGSAGCFSFTTCLNSVQSARFTTDNGLTLLCNQAAYPSCFKHVFVDRTSLTIYGCGRTSGTGRVFATPTDILSASASASGSASSRTAGSASSTATGTSTTDPTQSQQSSSSLPLGPIIGGAVGGAAAIGIFAFAIIFLARRSRRSAAGHPLEGSQAAAGVPPPPPGPGGYPPMQQQQQQGFLPVADPNAAGGPKQSPYSGHSSVYYDPRHASMAPTVSPPVSPSPAGTTQYGMGQQGTPPPQMWAAAAGVPQQHQPPPGYAPSPVQEGYQAQGPLPGGYAVPPGGYAVQGGVPPGHPNQQYPSRPMELPTGRGDGELRELA